MTGNAERGVLALWQHSGVRFVAIGAFNTGVAYAVYALGLFLGLHYALANLCALVASIVVGYHAQGRWTFGHAGPSRFGRFVFCWLVIYGANVTLIKMLLGLGSNPYVAGALAMVPMALLSYLLQRHLVFAPES